MTLFGRLASTSGCPMPLPQKEGKRLKSDCMTRWIFALLVLFCSSTAFAEEKRRPFELGVQITAVHLHKIDETPFGLGARASYDVAKHVAIDGEVDHYPENPSGNFGETAALVGFKSGWRSGRFGAFAKARAGMMNFGGGFFKQRLERKTVADADLGGVLEYYPSPRTVIRIDLGDTVLFYGSQSLQPSFPSHPLGTVHNFQPGFGFGWRF